MPSFMVRSLSAPSSTSNRQSLHDPCQKLTSELSCRRSWPSLCLLRPPAAIARSPHNPSQMQASWQCAAAYRLHPGSDEGSVRTKPGIQRSFQGFKLKGPHGLDLKKGITDIAMCTCIDLTFSRRFRALNMQAICKPCNLSSCGSWCESPALVSMVVPHRLRLSSGIVFKGA